MEERYRMIHYLCYCCAIFFALICLLLATRLSAQAQTRKAYVSQSEDKTTLTFYYDALRSTRTGTTWGIEETKKEGDIPVPAWAETWDVADYHHHRAWCSMLRSETSVPPPPRSGFIIV